MRRITITLILSLFLALGTGVAYADRHNDRDRHEQRDRGRGNNNRSHGHRPGGDKGRDRWDNHKGHKPDKSWNKHNSAPRPGHGYGRPAPPPPPPRPHHYRPSHYAPAPPPPPPHLGNMVRYATRGCRDVAVWQISPDTYIVKYRKGNRFYTRRLYPYANRYDAPNLISVNWAPMSPWTLIPSIHLNINL